MTSQPTVGVLSPLVGGFYFGGVLSGINAGARAHGGTVLAVQTFDAGLEHTDYAKPPPLTRLVGLDRVDGYVVLVDAVGAQDMEILEQLGKPVVVVSGEAGPSWPSVAPDNRAGVEAAIDHLVWHGHTRIGFAGCLAQSDMRERFEGYRDALAKHGISAGGSYYELEDSFERGGAAAGRALLAAGLPSTAIFAATDTNALGLMQVLLDAGLSLPKDQAVIGFDDTEAAQHATPRLSSVRQDFHDIGRAAVDLLLRQLRGEAVDLTLHRVPTALVRRQSCGCGHFGQPTPVKPRLASPRSARERLARSLVDAVRRPSVPMESRPAALTNAVDVIAAEMAAAAADGDHRPPAEVHAAMLGLYQLNPTVDTIDAVDAAVRAYAHAVRGTETDASLVLRTHVVTYSLAAAMQDAQFREKYRENTYFREAFNTQYTVSMALLADRPGMEHNLDWLSVTGASAGALGMWTDDRSALRTVGLYEAQTDGRSTPETGETPVELFPPDVLVQAARERVDQIALAVPIRAGANDWGWLCVVGPIEDKAYIGRENISQWASLLAVALEVAAKRHEVTDLSRELSVMLESSPDAVARYDAELRYRYLNRTAAENLGSGGDPDTGADEIIGRTDKELRRRHDVTERWVSALEQVVSSVAGTELEFSETTDDETRWFQARLVPLVDDEGLLVGVLSSSRDISDLKRAELSLAHQALHDGLTGLANRVLFLDRLTLAIAQLERLPGTLAVLFIDLDHFKEVNDTLGHEIGDRLLVQVAGRIQQLSRRSDTLARFGGDEFVLLCDRLAEDEDIRIIGERLGRTLAAPFHEQGHELRVSASIGIVVISDAFVEVATVIRNADEAMYSAKARGRDRFHVFDPELRERTAVRHSLEVDLRHALERDEFQLVYQPLFTLSTGAVIGVEALLRWHHPTRGVVAPLDFIGLAEQRGLIVAIGAWVIDESFRQLAEWSQQEELSSLGLAVNVSAKQLVDPAIVAVVQEALARHAIDPGRVTLEITETTLIEEAGGIRDTLHALRALGVRLALDDFGTGYSALVHLRDFPVNTLKIDRSFVEQLGSGSRATEIIGALTAMAHFLDMTVVGEGIERQDEWDELRDLGCDDGQGFLVSEPLAPADIVQLLLGLPAEPSASINE